MLFNTFFFKMRVIMPYSVPELIRVPCSLLFEVSISSFELIELLCLLLTSISEIQAAKFLFCTTVFTSCDICIPFHCSIICPKVKISISISYCHISNFTCFADSSHHSICNCRVKVCLCRQAFIQSKKNIWSSRPKRDFIASNGEPSCMKDGREMGFLRR